MTHAPVNIIKVGGKVVETPASLERFLDDFAALPGRRILVHGGGRSATATAASMGIETVMVNGRRVTDDAMLRIVTMVYGGLVNKTIVAALQARGINATGLTGADMDIIRARRRQPSDGVDWGWVGDVEKVDHTALSLLLDQGYTPVVAPLSHDSHGHILNTNADTIAQSIATALASTGTDDVTLTFCFEHPGVLADPADPRSVIPSIDSCAYARLKADGIVAGGMIPKLDNAFHALDSGVARVVITAADALADAGAGTMIVK